MKLLPHLCLCVILIAGGSTQSQTNLYDASIKHMPKDGIVKLYGAGGPHTALRKVAAAFEKETGIKVEIIAGPESKWSAKAQADADLMWGTAEQAMTAFLDTYTAFKPDTVMPIYIRPSVIAVQKDNPKQIKGFDDLLKPGMRIVVTEGGATYNTSGSGVWEDMAGRLGKLDDVVAFRRNIIAYAKGSGASYKAFKDGGADAWITWPNWPITNSDKADIVEIADNRKIWRDLNVALAPNADPEAKTFLDFLVTEQAAKLMKTEGWTR